MNTLPQMSSVEYRRPKNEKELQKRIVAEARRLGWRIYHTMYSPGSDRGYPDLTLTHPSYDKLWIEVKGPNPKIYPEQLSWLADINAGPTGLAIMAFPIDLDAVCELLAGRPVETWADERHGGALRVRLIEEE